MIGISIKLELIVYSPASRATSSLDHSGERHQPTWPSGADWFVLARESWSLVIVLCYVTCWEIILFGAAFMFLVSRAGGKIPWRFLRERNSTVWRCCCCCCCYSCFCCCCCSCCQWWTKGQSGTLGVSLWPSWSGQPELGRKFVCLHLFNYRSVSLPVSPPTKLAVRCFGAIPSAGHISLIL